MEYVYGFVVPWFAQKRGESLQATADTLVAQNDLRFIGDALRASGKIRHFANANDFLLADGDIERLTEVLGRAHVEFFPTGAPGGSVQARGAGGHHGSGDRPVGARGDRGGQIRAFGSVVRM